MFDVLCNHALQVMAADGLQGASEFENERVLLSKLHHAHLVRLLGMCDSRQPPLRCLVYELMPGGNVEEQLAHQVGHRDLRIGQGLWLVAAASSWSG